MPKLYAIGQVGQRVHLRRASCPRAPRRASSARRTPRDSRRPCARACCSGYQASIAGACRHRHVPVGAASTGRSSCLVGRRLRRSRACARLHASVSRGASSRLASNSASTWRRELLHAQCAHQDLDARLVDVVAPAVAVVDAQDRLEVGQQVGLRQELADHLARIGVRPRPPPTRTSKPMLAAADRA